MNLGDYEQLIANYGFPIVACIAIYIRSGKQDLLHKREIDALQSSLDNNTIAITKLYERMNKNA